MQIYRYKVYVYKIYIYIYSIVGTGVGISIGIGTIYKNVTRANNQNLTGDDASDALRILTYSLVIAIVNASFAILPNISTYTYMPLRFLCFRQRLQL